MKKDVIISIKSSQHNDSDSDSMELVTEGQMMQREGTFYIMYKESELTGLGGNTLLKLDSHANTMTLTRKGTSSSHMVFEPRKKHCTHYDTGYGVFNMGITTRKLNYDLKQDGGTVHLRYIIDIDNEYVSTNTIDLNIKEAAPHGKPHSVC